MKESDIVQIALENLEKAFKIRGKWKPLDKKEVDGKIDLFIDEQKLTFNIEVKAEIREHQLSRIIEKAERNKPFMVVAQRIYPKIKDALHKHQIPYLEWNGNIWLQQGKILLWLDNLKPLPISEEKVNRAFTKTGLKVVFQFLMDEQWINLPYREIANRTEVGLGNINYIMNGLLDNGYLLKQNQKVNRLTKKKDLLEKFITAYQKKLKPTLHIGTFRFLKKDDQENWKQINLKNQKTYWGGEPAGELLTKYLRPEVYTLYTNETRNELIKNYRLIPDPNGNVLAYKKFWTTPEVNNNVVPPLLVYTDLMYTADRRCIETANKIYEQYLKNKFE